jgi:hypothetical protein
MRKLVSIRRISKLEPIANADLIELARVDGWQTVVKVGEFKVGDYCVFFEIDSFLPTNQDAFRFLENKAITWNGKHGARLRTMKLRGVLSQGLALPVSLFESQFKAMLDHARNNSPNKEEFDWYLENVIDAPDILNDMDMASWLGVDKWEPYIPAQLAGTVKGNFPAFLRKTDQERIQNLWYDVKSRMDEYEITIKMEGSSMTVYIKDGEFGVCSRNLELKEEETNAFWKVANELKIKDKLYYCNLDNIAIQGELMGEGVQGNNEKFTGTHFFVYDIYEIKIGKYMDAYKRESIVKKLQLNHVPVLKFSTFDFDTMEQALLFADGPSYNNNVKREGVVFKSLNDPNFSFKIISNEYLLKNGDR